MAGYDVVVVGGGPAGHAAALRARELEADVALVEDQQPGGNCVHHTCIPTTVLLDTLDTVTRARELGIAGVLEVGETLFWGRAVARKQQLVAALAAGITQQLRNREVELLRGRARLVGPRTVHVALADGGERTLEAGSGVVLATGARPRPPAVAGVPPADVLWADTALRLPALPSSAAVLGGGAVGATFVLETAQIFAGAGARVSVIEPGPRLLPNDEPQVEEILVEMLRAQGMMVLVGARIVGAHAAEGGRVLEVEAQGASHLVAAEAVIAPDCRVPYAEDLGLEAAGARVDAEGVVADSSGATTAEGLFAAGDMTGAPMYSHVAAYQGRVAAESALGERTLADLRFVPRVVSTQPELAAVGLTEEAARAAGFRVVTGVGSLLTNARAVAMGQRDGLVKLVADARLGQVLGVHVLGPGAGELIGLAVLAMRLEATVEDLAGAVYWHPSLAEALTEAARRAAT